MPPRSGQTITSGGDAVGDSEWNCRRRELGCLSRVRQGLEGDFLRAELHPSGAGRVGSGARGRASDRREIVIYCIADGLNEDTALCRLSELGFVRPIGQEAHLEQHTWQGA
jgi:hypothetical protein